MKKWLKISLLAVSLGALNACATHHLLSKKSEETVRKVAQTIVQDNVVAFGKPAQAMNDLSTDTLVIVGQKHSYVLTKGGNQFFNLISRLDPRYIRVIDGLKLYSENNDGRFTSKLRFSYRRLKSDLSQADMQFFLQNGVQECTSNSDEKMNAQDFCFSIPLEGRIYPAVNNQASLRQLSHPYPIEVYTEVQQKEHSNHDDTGKKIVLFPFAVAFDVITLPLQAIYQIFD